MKARSVSTLSFCAVLVSACNGLSSSSNANFSPNLLNAEQKSPSSPALPTSAPIKTGSSGKPKPIPVKPIRSPLPGKSPEPLPSPIDWWKFDETTGTNASDSAGTHPGTLLSGAAWTEGNLGGAVGIGNSTFTGGGSATFPTNLPETFTLYFWAKANGYGATTGTENNIVLSGESYAKSGFRSGFAANGKFHFWTVQSGGTLSLYDTTPTSANVWVQFAITYQNGSASLYRNGAFVTSAEGTYVSGNTSMTTGSGINGVNPFWGALDDLRIYDQALTAAQVMSIYVSPPATTLTSTLTLTTADSGKTFSNYHISTTAGDCVSMTNVANVTFQNSDIGPCGTDQSNNLSNGFDINGGNKINLFDNYVHPEHLALLGSDTHDGIFVKNASYVTIQGNVVAYGESNIEANLSNYVTVDGNYMLNPRGPFPRGENYQGWGNSIAGPANTGHVVSNNYAYSCTLPPLAVAESNVILGGETYQKNGFRSAFTSEGRFHFWTVESGGTLSLDDTTITPEATWTQFAITYQNGLANLYKNGVLVSSAAGTYVPGAPNMGIDTGIAGVNTFWGAVRDVRIYAQVLSASDVTGLFTASSSLTATPVSWWMLNETAGLVAADSIGTGTNGNNPGTLTVGASWTRAKVNPALAFDPSFSGGSSVSFPTNLPSTFTLTFWVNPKGYSGIQGIQCPNDGPAYLYSEHQEDSINFGHSQAFFATSNYVNGGHSSTGCGIIDDQGANQGTFRENTLLNTGQCGIGVGSGINQVVDHNQVLNLTPIAGAGNVGIYVWNQYSTTCGPVMISNNASFAAQTNGSLTSYETFGGCGTITMTGDIFDESAFADLSTDEGLNKAPLIPPQPKNCSAVSPYSTQTSLPPCGQ